MKIGAVEAGGTKFVCAIGDENGQVSEQIKIPTTSPKETMDQVIKYFKKQQVDAIGVGTFGPIDVNKKSVKYGYVTKTPKLGWSDFDFLGTMKQALNVPISFTTDVNAAGYGEAVQGAGKGKENVLYWTIGTGIGAGYVQNGEFLQGISHPEMGHMLIRQNPNDGYEGHCPFHKNCFEGLAAGPAIEERIGKKAVELDPNDPVWDYVADYAAQACVNATLVLRPDIIIFGGGVIHQEHLLKKIRTHFKEQLNDYVDVPPLEEYIVRIGLNDDAGIKGALLLAAKELS
ncbi:ROK family protein [Pediococcus argentinicus]|uniref:ROK family protein n=1 Tax=Pediococcus argentinicus TaxID=480391 RepID=UPI003F491521